MAIVCGLLMIRNQILLLSIIQLDFSYQAWELVMELQIQDSIPTLCNNLPLELLTFTRKFLVHHCSSDDEAAIARLWINDLVALILYLRAELVQDHHRVLVTLVLGFHFGFLWLQGTDEMIGGSHVLLHSIETLHKYKWQNKWSSFSRSSFQTGNQKVNWTTSQHSLD